MKQILTIAIILLLFGCSKHEEVLPKNETEIEATDQSKAKTDSLSLPPPIIKLPKN